MELMLLKEFEFNLRPYELNAATIKNRRGENCMWTAISCICLASGAIFARQAEEKILFGLPPQVYI